ncbi:glycosyltransferase [Algoriphagus chordae]|uniref:Glycosyltransferase involved in cell wall biosynthesis n=1 Tax=Algoriphagus chordae TaxID=237019 RepID=A0A2W7RF04_9BACT|nr:glycosyltransferase [Algoriphagus chordae]PZX54197.1 glycosyltransferase involved in cell wall biosynthesis [Algoriphagus chordae]
MKILFIGDCNHQLLTSFIRSYSRFNSDEFSAFSIKKIKDDNKNIFENIQIARSFGKAYDNRVLRKLIYPFDIICRFLKLPISFDVIHIHLAKIQYLFIWPLLRFKGNKVVISVWGSEVLRANKWKMYVLGYMFRRADLIHCSNSALKEIVSEKFFVPISKIEAIPFFLDNLDMMDALNLNKVDAKANLNWNKRKIQVVIGYNFNQGQQHPLIISELAGLEKPILDEFEFVFPLTYGSEKANQEMIVKKARDIQADMIFYKHFLSQTDVSTIRVATDIFINLQITDQYSASMVEALYAGSIIITGSWLPYKSLKNSGVFFIELDSIQELSKTLIYVLNDIVDISKKAKVNKKIIEDMFESETLAQDWLSFYSLKGIA